MSNRTLKEFRKLAVTTLGDVLEPYGFRLKSRSKGEYSCQIVFVNGERYVKLKVEIANHPLCMPHHFAVVLGEGSWKRPECDWNSVDLWRLTRLASSTLGGSEYSLEYPEKLPWLLYHARSQLSEVAPGFLSGDLELFRRVCADQNRQRQPYEVYSRGQNGEYTFAVDQESVKLKERFS
jgi:hypothetical protein